MWILFTIIMLGIALSVAGVITVRLTAGTGVAFYARCLIAGAIVLIFMSPFLLRGPNTPINGPVHIALTYVAYFLFVCIFLFFCLMIARDIAWIIGKWIFPSLPSPFQVSAVLKANFGLLIVVVLLSGYALVEGTRVPRVKELTLYSDKIQEPLTIAVLPDIHIHRALSAKKLEGIIDTTNALRPDVIALPGDVIDDRADTIKDLVALLRRFQAPLGIFVTDGNHELYIGTRETRRQFSATRLVYLNNSAQLVRPDVRIAGVPDIQSARFGQPADMKKALPENSAYTILLAHTPKMFDLPDNTADLQLSGHTHGGQIFPFHFLAKLSNRYLAGLYERDGRHLYVSRGAGQWGPQMRLFAPSEITFIRVLPTRQALDKASKI